MITIFRFSSFIPCLFTNDKSLVEYNFEVKDA